MLKQVQHDIQFMKAIIVAGGQGKRLKPLTDKIPKPMIQVAGKPILEHIVNHLKQYGIQDFIFALCYLPKVITAYFGDGSRFGVRIRYTSEASPRGTAGAILKSKRYIQETFIVTYADILRELDIAAMIKLHRKKHALATINVYKRFGLSPKSIVLFDKEKRVQRFIERPTNKDVQKDFVWANGSFYIFELEIFNFIPENKPSDFGRHIFPELIKKNKAIFVYPTDSYFVDIGNKQKLELARKTYPRNWG